MQCIAYIPSVISFPPHSTIQEYSDWFGPSMWVDLHWPWHHSPFHQTICGSKPSGVPGPGASERLDWCFIWRWYNKFSIIFYLLITIIWTLFCHILFACLLLFSILPSLHIWLAFPWMIHFHYFKPWIFLFCCSDCSSSNALLILANKCWKSSGWVKVSLQCSNLLLEVSFCFWPGLHPWKITSHQKVTHFILFSLLAKPLCWMRTYVVSLAS